MVVWRNTPLHKDQRNPRSHVPSFIHKLSFHLFGEHLRVRLRISKNSRLINPRNVSIYLKRTLSVGSSYNSNNFVGPNIVKKMGFRWEDDPRTLGDQTRISRTVDTDTYESEDGRSTKHKGFRFETPVEETLRKGTEDPFLISWTKVSWTI